MGSKVKHIDLKLLETNVDMKSVLPNIHIATGEKYKVHVSFKQQFTQSKNDMYCFAILHYLVVVLSGERWKK